MTQDAFGLKQSYYDKQIARNIRVIESIRARSLSMGRVVPDPSNIPFYDGRRMDATVMFLDICSFSARPSSTAEEQENLLRILSLFFTEMIRIVEDYGGFVEKNTGDGLMAYFVHEGDEVPMQQRALTAALTMFHAAYSIINPVIIRSGMQAIDFRICLDHGPITTAKVGASRGFNGIVAIGATANIASKMLAYADRNTILVGTMVLGGLPDEWKERFVELKTADTGWIFTSDERPYAFWEYKGRWTGPVQ